MPKLLRITTVPVSLHSLIRGQMRFMKEQGFTVWMASADGEGLDSLQEREGCPHYVLPLTRKITPFRDLQALWSTYRLIRRLRPDIVHTHTPKAGLIGMLAAWLARIPVRLHTVAGLPLMERQGQMQKLLIWIERLTYGCSTGVYPNSEALRRYITAHISDSPKLRVIGRGSSNGIDSAYYCLTPALREQALELRLQFGIEAHAFVWVFVGRMVRQKGVEELIMAYSRLSQSHKNMRLLLVGPFEDDLDPISSETRAIISSRPDIIHVGFQRDVRPYLALANALVFPSYREGFPNVPMQAACLELPMILSNINGCNELVEDGESGLLVPVKDTNALYQAMLRLIDDNALQQQFRQRGRELIMAGYDQTWVWKQILAEYERCLTEKKIAIDDEHPADTPVFPAA